METIISKTTQKISELLSRERGKKATISIRELGIPKPWLLVIDELEVNDDLGRTWVLDKKDGGRLVFSRKD